MAITDIEHGAEGKLPSLPQRKPDALMHPDGILLYPADASLPGDWQAAWSQAGWIVTNCGSPDELADAIAHPVDAMRLLAAPWPAAGNALSSGIVFHGLQSVIAALGLVDHDAVVGSAISSGMLRRGDFLANLVLVMNAPDSDGWVLMAIRVDQVAGLATQFDRSAIFDLEEKIVACIAAELHEIDAVTIWLEFGFGVLVQRESREQVQVLADRICASVAGKQFGVAAKQVSLTVSIGLALPPKVATAERAGRWFASAHAAQAIAHRHGGNRHEGVLTREYEPMPAERVLIIREWVQEANSGDNVMLDFQPVLPLSYGTKALYLVCTKLRDFRAPLAGVYRREFLRMAREAGTIQMIDRLSLFGAFELLEQEHARGRDTRLLVPVDFSILAGVPWRWLEAELQRRSHLAESFIVEIEASQDLQSPGSAERIQQLRGLGVQVGVADFSGGLDALPSLCMLPIDVLRLQLAAVDTVSPQTFMGQLAPWRGKGLQVIVDDVADRAAMARFSGLGVDYLCGPGVAAIGPRLDYDFS